MCFSAAPSSEKAMNLASNTASVLSTTPSRVAAVQNRTGCRTQRCTSLSHFAGVRLVERRLFILAMGVLRRSSCVMNFVGFPVKARRRQRNDPLRTRRAQHSAAAIAAGTVLVARDRPHAERYSPPRPRGWTAPVARAKDTAMD